MDGAPSNRVCRILVYAIAVLLGLSFWGAPIFDPDLGWQLFGGSFVVANGSVPRADPINSFNLFWHDYHWLCQAAMYLIYESFSFPGLSVTLALVMAWLGLVLVDLARTVDPELRHPLAVTAAVALVFLLFTQVISVRPQAAALLLVALAMRRLCGESRCWELPYLFVLTCIAVNVHVYWVFIPALWAVYRLIPVLLSAHERSLRVPFGGLLLLGSAGFISPYGALRGAGVDQPIWFNYALLFDYGVMPESLRTRIGELLGSLQQQGAGPYALLLMAIVFARTFSARRARVRISETLLFICGFIGALRATKFLAVFALFSLPAMVRSFVLGVRRWRVIPQPGARATTAILAVLAALAGARTLYRVPNYADQLLSIKEYQPLDACRAIARLNLAPRAELGHLRILTHFNNGGWCRWAVAQENPALDARVTTDGRTQWVPPEHYDLSFDLFNVKNRWAETLVNWNPDVLLVPRDRALFEMIRRMPEKFRRVFEDEGFAVYVPIGR